MSLLFYEAVGIGDADGKGAGFIKLKNVFYHHTLLPIGGIETFMYEMAKSYSKSYDITVMYKKADERQLERLSRYVRCVKYTGQNFKCERLFTTYDISVIDTCEADYIAQVIHANYKAIKLKPNTHPRINEYIAVSETVADAYKELSGIECKVIYNPLMPDKPKRVLHLISATRLTKEKGRARMEILADKFTEAGIPFTWLVFTNSTEGFNNPNMIMLPPRLDLTDYIADADYLVQLSDTEGYCYSVNEALNLGTSVIVTDLETFKEEGVTKDNGFLLPLDMENIDVKAIYNARMKFEYSPREDSWSEMLAKGKSDYTKKLKETHLVEATGEYERLQVIDSALNTIPREGVRFSVNGIRLDTLLGNNRYGVAFVREIPPATTQKKTPTPVGSEEGDG